MFARSTTIHANPTAIDAGVAHIRDEVFPTLRTLDGCVGMSVLVDRSSGRCIATAAWESLETMRAAAETVSPMRERAAEIMGGTPEVEEWEIAVMHRNHESHEGACVRTNWVRLQSAGVDRAIDVFKLAALPGLEEQEGFCSASLMVNRESGRAVSSVTYDSFEAMDRSREQAAAVRTAATKEAGVEVFEVSEFELALAHLHVPELV